MKIGIFMWFNNNYKEFGDINYKINKIYSDKHNYEIIKDEKIRNIEYNDILFFQRYALLLEYSKYEYDYLVWIDADAYFYIDSPPIENIINETFNICK